MANNALIGAVRAEATLESGKFVSGSRKLRQEAKATETQLKKSFSVMGAAAKGFGGALAAGLSVGLLAGLAKKALDYAGSLGEVAQSLGVTTKHLQTFRFAVQQNGGTVEQADQALGKFAISISKALSGSEQAAEAFAAVGVSLKDLQTKSKPEILGIIADQMKKTGGASANAAAGVAIFGKGFLKIAPTLDQGSQGLNELSAAAERLGIVLSDRQIQEADRTADKLDAVKTVLAAQIAGVVADNAASIVSLAQALATLTSSIVNFLGSNPQLALGILGGLAGSRFGPIGAAVGAGGGIFLGENMAVNARNTNMDLAFRRQRLREAQARYAAAKKAGGGGVVRGDRGEIIQDRRSTFKAAEEGLRREIDLTRQANAAARSRMVRSPAGAPLPEFLGGGGGGKRTPKAPRDRSDDVTFQFDQELRRAHMDVLRAQQGLARTSEERAKIALQLLDAEREAQEAELQDRVRRAEKDFAEGKITQGALDQAKVQAEKLRAEYAEVDALERKAIADDLAAQKAQDAAALTDSAYDLRLEQLQLEAGLAETASERRSAELRILSLMKEQERARLNAVLADKDSSDLARAEAQLRLDNLDAIYSGRRASVMQGTQGPMEDWLAQLPTTAAKSQEALERLQVQGFDGLIDAALALSEGFDSAKDALLNTLKQFLLGLARMELQKLAGSLISGGIPGFATGGSFMVRGVPGIDKNIMSIGGLPVARVSYGERVSISNDNDRSMNSNRAGDVNFNIYGVTDGDSFRRNERQISRTAKRKLGIQ